MHISKLEDDIFCEYTPLPGWNLLSIKLKESERHPNKGFDIPGQLTWMLTLTALISAIIEWHHLGLKHPLIYGGLIFSAIMLALFLWIEKKATAPILPLDLFKSANLMF